ncbi:glycine cleavage system aminomethyltransferase GcvT [Alkalicoccus chagannorensis]|uniref:glycine cleavage system aminomethyltransferase GcvT n=1 Tax=Alkalicoccus chagannorensis TaxID=427072 RepID=UPI000400F114|nr:glycine cleavage system aminomethyltransferase GcvT [Alkalicoccus chagannorensis]
MGNKTPLHPLYEQYGAKVIDFGGWDLPVQFSSIKEEHHAVRTKAGLFDVSHMGEIRITGEDTIPFLQRLLTNDLAKVKHGQCQYTVLCYEDGGTVDDLVLYKTADDDVLLIVNAANTAKNEEWIRSNLKEEQVHIANESDETAQLAVQGPEAEEILQQLTGTNLQDIGFFRFQSNVDMDGASVLISRTGYTGEDGFEIYCRPEDAPGLWKTLVAAGARPIGLGARDTLRFEARLALYGQELSRDITPIEAGIGFAVKPGKGITFIGEEVLREQKENGPSRKLAGIEMVDKAIPRHGYDVFHNGEPVGFVTSGTQSPTLGKNVGLALIDSGLKEMGTEVEVEIRGKRKRAVVTATPFYQRNK